MTDPMEKLRSLEWSYSAQESTGRLANDYIVIPACPECYGYKPGALSNSNASAYGHRGTCQLGAMLSGEPDAMDRLSERRRQIDDIDAKIENIERVRAEYEDAMRQAYADKQRLYAEREAIEKGNTP